MVKLTKKIKNNVKLLQFFPAKSWILFQLLEKYGVTLTNYQTGQHKANAKRAVVDMARHWLTYFARIFPLTVSSLLKYRITI